MATGSKTPRKVHWDDEFAINVTSSEINALCKGQHPSAEMSETDKKNVIHSKKQEIFKPEDNTLSGRIMDKEFKSGDIVQEDHAVDRLENTPHIAEHVQTLDSQVAPSMSEGDGDEGFVDLSYEKDLLAKGGWFEDQIMSIQTTLAQASVSDDVGFSHEIYRCITIFALEIVALFGDDQECREHLQHLKEKVLEFDSNNLFHQDQREKLRVTFLEARKGLLSLNTAFDLRKKEIYDTNAKRVVSETELADDKKAKQEERRLNVAVKQNILEHDTAKLDLQAELREQKYAHQREVKQLEDRNERLRLEHDDALDKYRRDTEELLDDEVKKRKDLQRTLEINTSLNDALKEEFRKAGRTIREGSFKYHEQQHQNSKLKSEVTALVERIQFMEDQHRWDVNSVEEAAKQQLDDLRTQKDAEIARLTARLSLAGEVYQREQRKQVMQVEHVLTNEAAILPMFSHGTQTTGKIFCDNEERDALILIEDQRLNGEQIVSRVEGYKELERDNTIFKFRIIELEREVERSEARNAEITSRLEELKSMYQSIGHVSKRSTTYLQTPNFFDSISSGPATLTPANLASSAQVHEATSSIQREVEDLRLQLQMYQPGDRPSNKRTLDFLSENAKLKAQVESLEHEAVPLTENACLIENVELRLKVKNLAKVCKEMRGTSIKAQEFELEVIQLRKEVTDLKEQVRLLTIEANVNPFCALDVIMGIDPEAAATPTPPDSPGHTLTLRDELTTSSLREELAACRSEIAYLQNVERDTAYQHSISVAQLVSQREHINARAKCLADALDEANHRVVQLSKTVVEQKSRLHRLEGMGHGGEGEKLRQLEREGERT
jgi:hypothetical protein